MEKTKIPQSWTQSNRMWLPCKVRTESSLKGEHPCPLHLPTCLIFSQDHILSNYPTNQPTIKNINKTQQSEKNDWNFNCNHDKKRDRGTTSTRLLALFESEAMALTLWNWECEWKEEDPCGLNQEGCLLLKELHEGRKTWWLHGKWEEAMDGLWGLSSCSPKLSAWKSSSNLLIGVGMF